MMSLWCNNYRAETEMMLKNAREQQIRNKEHFLAVQAQRDRSEFERVLKYQQLIIIIIREFVIDCSKRKYLMKRNFIKSWNQRNVNMQLKLGIKWR